MKGSEHIGLQTNKELIELIGLRIQKERISQGLQQKELALKAEVPLNAIRRLEQSGQIAFEKLVKVIRALNRLSELASFMDFSQDDELLSYDEYRERKSDEKKRIFKNDESDEVYEW